MTGPSRPGGDQPAEPRDFAATLLEFAGPMIDDPDDVGGAADRDELHARLALAAIAWNAGVMLALGSRPYMLDTVRRCIHDFPAAKRKAVELVLEGLVERKQRDFAGDLRGLGSFELLAPDGSGEVRIRVHEISLSELAFTRRAAEAQMHFGDEAGDASREPDPKPKRARPPKQFVVDMRHYATEHGLLAGIPRPAREIASFFGTVVSATSARPNAVGAKLEIGVPCRRRTGAGRCDGRLRARRVGREETIEWVCGKCQESGTIDGWHGSVWDHAGRAQALASLPAKDRLQLSLSDQDLRALRGLTCLHFDSLAVLAAARREAKHNVLALSRTELEELALSVSAEKIELEGSQTTLRVFKLEDRLHAALGYDEAAAEVARTTAVLAWRARADRATCRGVPRAEGKEGRSAHRLAVELEDVKPAVRRELVVHSDTTLEELHAILQVAFGWSESHLHAFIVGKKRYMNVRQSEELDAKPSHLITVAQALPRSDAWLRYEYDFGDSWGLLVRAREIGPVAGNEPLPRCLRGANATPPEDVGGPGGYEDFLDAIEDPRHESHADMQRWIGRPFDPRAFDLEFTNRLLAQLGRWQA